MGPATKERLRAAGVNAMTAWPELKAAYTSRLASPDHPHGLKRLSRIQTVGDFDAVVSFLIAELRAAPERADAWIAWAKANADADACDPVTAALYSARVTRGLKRALD